MSTTFRSHRRPKSLVLGLGLLGCVRGGEAQVAAPEAARSPAPRVAPACAGAECEAQAQAALHEGRPADAIALFDRGCAFGQASACARLAGLVAGGAAGARDPGRAVGLYERACQLGAADACGAAAAILSEGSSVPADPGRALGLWVAGCARQDAGACFAAGTRLEAGTAGAREPERAAESFASACELGHAMGCYNAGVLLFRETGAQPGGNERAVGLYGRACEGGVADGCLRQGLAALRGLGAPVDRKRAVGLFTRACAGGAADGCAAKEQVSRARGREVAIALTTRVPSFTIRGLTVRDLACRMVETDAMAVAEVVDGIAGQRAALDACAPAGAVVPVTWSYQGGHAGAIKVERADKKVAACVRKAVSAARASQTASCTATLLIGAAEGAQRELAARGGVGAGTGS